MKVHGERRRPAERQCLRKRLDITGLLGTGSTNVIRLEEGVAEEVASSVELAISADELIDNAAS